MSLDLELAKILNEFAVPEAFRTKLVDSACLKVWQFAEYVDDVKDWTGILSSLEPPIVDRMHIASVRRAYKAACARDAELLSRGRDYPGEDMDAPIESNRRRTLIEEHARHYRFQLQLSRQPSDTLLLRKRDQRNISSPRRHTSLPVLTTTFLLSNNAKPPSLVSNYTVLLRICGNTSGKLALV